MNNPLVQPDPGLYIWTILTFLVLMVLLARFAWRPLLEALERRASAIRQSLDDVRTAKEELARVHGESARILGESRAKADEILNATRADADIAAPLANRGMLLSPTIELVKGVEEAIERKLRLPLGHLDAVVGKRILCKAAGTDAVDRTEVDRLCRLPLFRGHLLDRNAGNL